MQEVGGVKYRTKEMLSKLSKSTTFRVDGLPGLDIYRIPGKIHSGFVRCFWRIKLNTPDPITDLSNYVVEMYKGDNNTIGEGFDNPPITPNDILREKIATFRIPHVTHKLDIDKDILSPFIIVRPDYSDTNNPKNNRIYFKSTYGESHIYVTVDYYDIEG